MSDAETIHRQNEMAQSQFAITNDPTLERVLYEPATPIRRGFIPHRVTGLAKRLLLASNGLFETSRWVHAPDGNPVSEPHTTRHANHKPSCK